MTSLAVPFLVTAGLLALGGAAKIASPVPTVIALRAAGFPAAPVAVRVLGMLEIVLAVAAVASGSSLAAAMVAVAYLGFAGYVALAMRRGGADCGCFGQPEAPVSSVHVVVNLAFAVVAAAVAIAGPPAPGDLVDAGATGTAVVVLAVVGVELAYLLLTGLPAVTRELARR